MDANTRLHNSKWLIPVNQSPHLTKDRFCLNHFELCNLMRVERKQHILNKDYYYFVYNFGKAQITLSKIFISSDISTKLQGR